jgi:hypothetical protein
MIAEIEKKLTEKVAEILKDTGFRVEALPDTSNFIMTHPKGAAFVVNKGSRYDAPESTGSARQRRVLSFEVSLWVKNLRSHEGAYGAIDLLAYGLAGWKAQGAGFGAWIEREGFVDKKESVWVWSLDLAVPVYLIPKPPEKAAPLIKQIVAKTDTDTIEVKSEQN